MRVMDQHRTALSRLAGQNRLRTLIPQAGIDFASNDYLGFATSSELRNAISDALARGVPVGAGGSRLLRGNHPEHEALEAEAAALFGSEAALFFTNGFAANGAIFANLPDRRDLIVHDSLIHASVHDGMRLGFAETVSVPHNDMAAIDTAISDWRSRGGKGTPWIALESLYSMDGDRADLATAAAIAERHQAMLVIDEAHAAGVFGTDGRGLAAALGPHENLIRLVTCGKALGCEGALVLAAKPIIDRLVNSGRSFVFSTAPSPLMAAAVRASLRLLKRQPERRAALAARVTAAERMLGLSSGSQILPLIIGDDGETMRIASELQRHGFDVRGIRPPTVPRDTARLRISITLNVSEEDIVALGRALQGLRQ